MAAEIDDAVDGLVTVRLSGHLLESELSTLQHHLAEIIPALGKVRILIIAEAFEGWEQGGEWNDFTLQENNDPHIEKMAIVGDRQWEDLALLFRISRLPLQLMPMHQDGAGGLGFLASYPGIFSGLAFALGCAVASGMLKELAYVDRKPELVWFAIGTWLVFNLILYVGPLLVFAMPLYAARERGLIEYGRLANQLNLAFHRKWIEGRISGEDLAGSSELSAASGLDARIRTIRDMRLIPVDRVAILQLLIVTGAPMLAVVTTLVPRNRGSATSGTRSCWRSPNAACWTSWVWMRSTKPRAKACASPWMMSG